MVYNLLSNIKHCILRQGSNAGLNKMSKCWKLETTDSKYHILDCVKSSLLLLMLFLVLHTRRNNVPLPITFHSESAANYIKFITIFWLLQNVMEKSCIWVELIKKIFNNKQIDIAYFKPFSRFPFFAK